MSDYSFRPGDDLWNILRKLLALLNTSTIVAASSTTTPSQGDTSWCFFRKILLRLVELVPDTTAAYEQGDSQWALVRKILQVLNENTLVAETSYTLFSPGDSLEVVSRKILERLCALVPDVSDVYRYRPGDSLNSIWRKILSIFDLDVDAPFAPGTLEAPSDFRLAILDWAGMVKVMWQDNSSTETGFEVYISTDGTNYSLSTTVDPNTTHAVLTGLIDDVYWFKVRAIRGADASAFAGPISANPITGGVPELSGTYVDDVVTELDITVDNISDPPGDVVVYESDNDDLTDPVEVDVITLPPNSGGRSHTISNHGVSVTRRNVFARQRTPGLVTSGPSATLPAIDPAFGETIADTWAGTVVDNGGAQPSATTLAAVGSFVGRLRLANIWSKMKLVNLVAPDSEIAARTPLVAGGGNVLWGKTGTLSLDRDGIAAGASNSYMDTGFNPSTMLTSATNCGLTIYLGSHFSRSYNQGFFGCDDSSRFNQGYSYTNTSFYSTIGNAVGGNADAGRSEYQHGYWSYNCTAATSRKLFCRTPRLSHQTFVNNTNNESTALPNRAMYALTINVAGSAAANVELRHRISFFAAHDGLTEAESSAMCNAVEALRYALGGGYVDHDSDSAASLVSRYDNNIQLRGGAALSAGTKAALTTFWDSIRTGSLNSKMSIVMPFVPDSFVAATMPFFRAAGPTSWTNNNFVSGDLTVNGLIGNGSSKWFNATIHSDDFFFPGDSHHFAYYDVTNVDENKRFFETHSGSGTSAGYALFSYSGGTFLYSGNQAAWGPTPGLASFRGYRCGVKLAANDRRIFRANPAIGHGVLGTNTYNEGDIRMSAGYLSSNRFCLFCGMANGSPYDYVSHRVSFASFGDGLNEVESSLYYDAVQALRVALGGGYAPDAAVDWADRVEANGGARPSSTTIDAAQDFIEAIDAAGIRSKMIAVNIVAPDSTTAQRTPLIYNSGMKSFWTEAGGNPGSIELTANGVRPTNANYAQELATDIRAVIAAAGGSNGNLGLTEYVYTNSAEGLSNFGVGEGSAWFWLHEYHSAAGAIIFFAPNNAASGDTRWTTAIKEGFISGSRESTSLARLYFANSSTAFSKVAENTNGPVANDIPARTMFAVGSAIIFSGYFTSTTRRSSFFAVHLGLTEAQTGALYNAVQALRVALGGGYR